jgi:hydroxymethylpyrimidine pyrophosphatase-like HAD family hydrolase
MDEPARRVVEPLPRPRLLACDIDGTLLDDHGVLRSAVRHAVEAIRGTGVEVVIATGRSPWTGVGSIAAELGLGGLQITMQGALISDLVTGETLREEVLPPDLYAHALGFAARHGLEPIVSLVDGHRAGRNLGRDAWGRVPVESDTFRLVGDLAAVVGERPMRVYLPIAPERFRGLLDAAIEWAGARASVVWSDGTGLEFLTPGTHKGSAIAALAAHRGLTLDDVAAVGDQANDREMLTMAGRSAAMGDAPPDVAACADIVVPSSRDTGILEAFAWFFPDLAPGLLDAPAA